MVRDGISSLRAVCWPLYLSLIHILYYEASVCGAIPIINALMNPLQANRITKLMGIINGTTNYILSRMSAQGESYDTVLKDAQKDV